MTCTASSKGKIFMDFDSYKNQEWLRRRKLRLEQVRKQSNEIARALRQKVSREEKRRLEEYERLKEEKLKIWKAGKLEELEEKLKCALEGFGAGYRLAEEEHNAGVVVEEQIKINLFKAQKRGEIARQEELKKNKLMKEKLTSSINRKKLTRKKEDLRSALVRTLPLKKQLIDIQEKNIKLLEDPIDTGKPTVTITKKTVKKAANKCNGATSQKRVQRRTRKKKQGVSHKLCGCNCKEPEGDICPAEEPEGVWVNLDEMQISSACESGPGLKSSKSTVCSRKSQKERSEGSVEFYDFSSRYYCKAFREFPHLVERIDHDSAELNANELARVEEERNREEDEKRLRVEAVRQGRGMEALRKERISREYNNLMAKLEELSKKEKILKSQQRSTPSFLHMDDRRLSERSKTKQRIMESKFESVYYEATTTIPHMGIPFPGPTHNLVGSGDYFQVDERPTTGLSFSASNLKHNSPATSAPNSIPEVSPQTKPTHSQLLQNINKALREGREIRRTMSRKWKSESSGGEEEKEEEGSGSETIESEEEEEEEEELVEKSERRLRKCQESQTEDMGEVERRELRLMSCDTGGDDSVAVSTSTSYKSPPSVIRRDRVEQFLDYLEGVSELHGDKKIKEKMNGILLDLLQGVDSAEHRERKSHVNPALEYYIEKLLNMSRECIANLSISSENVSTPNITELDVRNDSEVLDSDCVSRLSSRGEDLIRKSRLDRADTLEKSIKNWRMILGKRSSNSRNTSLLELKWMQTVVEKKPGKQVEGSEDVVDSPRPKQMEDNKEVETASPAPLIRSPKIKSRYDEITKKCSERISELTEMLEKIRKDKERLLGSASGGSSVDLSRSERGSEKELDVEEKEVAPPLKMITRENPSTTAVANSQSNQNLSESLESWPDVMDELLKKEILSSPFKWSSGDHSLELTTTSDPRKKPSSIESVIGNFRKEIDKLKPFSLAEPTQSPTNPRWSTERSYRELWSPQTGLSRDESGAESDEPFQEESSAESINHCLTSLGLNWAKSFLRKNAESRAMSSSSDSEKKFSEDEEEN